VFENLSRENIGQYVVREIGRPKWRDARVKIVEVDGHRAILKDVHDRNLLFRFFVGRYLIRREFKLYKALEDVQGVPRAYRLLDKDAFLVEYVDGMPPRRYKHRVARLKDPFYDECFRLIDELHRRGLVHLDLRNKNNFLIAEGARVYIVDFASAMQLPRWLPFRRFWVLVLGAFDRAGVLKMKERLSRGQVSAQDRKRLARFERTRAIFFPPVLVLQLVRRLLRKRRKAKGKRRAGS